MICRRVSDKSLLRLSTGGRAQYRCRGRRHLAAHPRRPGHHERALVVLVCSRAPEFKAFLQRACDIGRRRPDLARCHYQGVCAHARPRTRSSAQAQPRNAEGRHLRDAVIVEARDKLLVFLTRRDVEPTNNESERDLRPSVIRSRTGRTGAPRSTPISAPLSEPAAQRQEFPSPPSAPLSRCVPSSPPPLDHWGGGKG